MLSTSGMKKRGVTRLKQIGRGSFGIVYLVHRESDGLKCVEKSIILEGLTEKQLDDVEKEVKVLGRLKHRYVASYIDSFRDEEGVHILMEYASGGTLQHKIKAAAAGTENIDESRALDWFTQCLLALRLVHGERIIHRDIKAANVFLSGAGEVKLGDFGLARVMSSRTEFAETVLGTPYYMAPELVNGSAYDAKTDVWALGCLLYELAMHTPPFSAGNFGALVMKIMRGTFPPVSSAFSDEYAALVGEMLQRDPADRPAVEELLSRPILADHIERWGKDVSAATGADDVPGTPVSTAAVLGADGGFGSDTISASVPRGSRGGAPTSSLRASSSTMASSAVTDHALSGTAASFGVSVAHSSSFSSSSSSSLSSSIGVEGVYVWGQGQTKPKRVDHFVDSGALEGGAACVAAGGASNPFFCVVDADGALWSWGAGGHGQLGRGSMRDSKVPGRVTGLGDRRAVAVACGQEHVLCVCDDGSLWSWGCNEEGQLGVGSTKSLSEPREVDLLENYSIAGIAAGDSFSVAFASDGTLFTWGRNGEGQLGLGEDAPGVVVVPTPVHLLAGRKVVDIAAGADHALAVAVDEDGQARVYGWGSGELGKIGRKACTDSPSPKVVKALLGKGIVAVAAGASHSVALASSGVVFSWGDNSSGQCAQGAEDSIVATPALVGALRGETVVRVSCGEEHTAVLTDEGRVLTFGRNELNLSLGHSFEMESQRKPQEVSGLRGKRSVLLDCASTVTIVIVDASVPTA